jgi:hypothetical protein
MYLAVGEKRDWIKSYKSAMRKWQKMDFRAHAKMPATQDAWKFTGDCFNSE